MGPGIARGSNIIQRSNATRSLHSELRDALRKMSIQLEVETGQHAISIDIGAQQVTRTACGIPGSKFVEGARFAFGPAGTRQSPTIIDAACIQRNRQAFRAMSSQPASDELRLADGYATQHHALNAGIE